MSGLRRRRHARLSGRGLAGGLRTSPGRQGLMLEIDNLSRGGIFIRSHFPLDLDSIVSLDLEHPIDRDRLTVTGRVVNVVSQADARRKGTPAGLGITFSDLAEGDLERIDKLLAYLEAPEAYAAEAAARVEAERANRPGKNDFDFGFTSLTDEADTAWGGVALDSGSYKAVTASAPTTPAASAGFSAPMTTGPSGEQTVQVPASWLAALTQLQATLAAQGQGGQAPAPTGAAELGADSSAAAVASGSPAKVGALSAHGAEYAKMLQGEDEAISATDDRTDPAAFPAHLPTPGIAPTTNASTQRQSVAIGATTPPQGQNAPVRTATPSQGQSAIPTATPPQGQTAPVATAAPSQGQSAVPTATPPQGQTASVRTATPPQGQSTVIGTATPTQGQPAPVRTATPPGLTPRASGAVPQRRATPPDAALSPAASSLPSHAQSNPTPVPSHIRLQVQLRGIASDLQTKTTELEGKRETLRTLELERDRLRDELAEKRRRLAEFLTS